MATLSRREFVKDTVIAGAVTAAAPQGVAAAAGQLASNPEAHKDSLKIYVMTDLEGAAMISRWDQARDATPEVLAQSRKFVTREINAAVDGILEAAPHAEVIVWDGHGSGGIDICEFHPKAKLIPRGPIKPPYFLDSTFDAVFFVGQHAMAGTPNAPLCHTYSSKTVEYYRINGQYVGEFGARTIMAGTFGVPVIFISGDDKAVAEAKTMVPDIHGAVVKQGLGTELALHLSAQAAQELIRTTATHAVADIGKIKPVKLDPPYEQEIRVYKKEQLSGYLKNGARKIDDRTVLIKSDNICDLHV